MLLVFLPIFSINLWQTNYLHVCMYACMHVCLYACMHVCRYSCMHVCMYACMHVCMYACMYVCMYACMYVCSYVLVCMYACNVSAVSDPKPPNASIQPLVFLKIPTIHSFNTRYSCLPRWNILFPNLKKCPNYVNTFVSIQSIIDSFTSTFV